MAGRGSRGSEGERNLPQVTANERGQRRDEKVGWRPQPESHLPCLLHGQRDTVVLRVKPWVQQSL